MCSENKYAHFDVSYQYNGIGEIQFVIDVSIEENDWMVRKNVQNVRYLLNKLKI